MPKKCWNRESIRARDIVTSRHHLDRQFPAYTLGVKKTSKNHFQPGACRQSSGISHPRVGAPAHYARRHGAEKPSAGGHWAERRKPPKLGMAELVSLSIHLERTERSPPGDRTMALEHLVEHVARIYSS